MRKVYRTGWLAAEQDAFPAAQHRMQVKQNSAMTPSAPVTVENVGLNTDGGKVTHS